MKESIKEKWAIALESGDYVQGNSELRMSFSPDNDEENVETHHCCLGVLADIVDPEGWSGDLWHNDGVEFNLSNLDRVGLSPELQTVFITLNDDVGLDFEQIAQVVRELPAR